jgi:Holliday junction resolvasome RuvABC ATP-dependent DNA helicase subunit
MSILSRVLADIAAKHVAEVLSTERDCRLIFPGLTESLAIKLHQDLRRRLAAGAVGGSTSIPVYLALDYPGSGFEPDEAKDWLHYEAVTSVRHGSFITVCMPKVLPKLHDSIRGSGGPIRGLTFADEWPWKDVGAEAFRFSGPILEALLDTWSPDPDSRRWIKELVLDGLLPATAPLRDAVRVPLLLEEILGSFDTALYPDLDDVVDKFCFHCGIPRVASRENAKPADHVDVVVRTAKALEDQRRKNPNFRDYLVNEVAASTFAALETDALEQLKTSLDLLLDGALELGADSGVLAYRGGLGNGSSSVSVHAWSALDVDRLMEILGVGERDTVRCTASLPEGGGVVSNDGRHVAIFEGVPLQLDVAAKIGEDRFVSGDFLLRCKRRQRLVYECVCSDAEFQAVVSVPPRELPGTPSRLSLVVQLVRFQKVVSEARVHVHVCGPARPALGVFEPGFDVVDFLESEEPDSTDSESAVLACREPVRVHVLDWEATDPCRVMADDKSLQVDIAEAPAGGAAGPTRYSLRDAIDVENFAGARVDLRIHTSEFVREVTLAGEDVEPGEFTLEDELRVAAATASASRLHRVLPFFRGDGDLVLPKLGELDAASRRRMDLARAFEGPDGWKPVLVDFVEPVGSGINEPIPQQFWRTAGESQAFLRDMSPTEAFKRALAEYVERREAVIERARSYVHKYATPSERPLYVVAPNHVARDDVSIEIGLSRYLAAYGGILDLLRDGSLSAGEVFTLVHLDAVVLERVRATDSQLDLRMSLLGPWHPLVAAKRFMVQHWIYAAAEGSDRLVKQHMRLAALFERVDGFRVVPGFDADSLGLDVSFAFPTSDPGWHLAVASGAFSALTGSTFGSLRGFGERLRGSLGLRSSLYLAGTDLWSETFVRSFQRSHPSRHQLGLRVSHGLDARPVVDSCARLLDDQQTRSGRFGALLPGGIHLFLEDRLTERQPLPWQQPAVLVYEELEDARCYEYFHPDILLLPQREETRPAWLPGKTEEGVAVPRGRDRAVVFSMPLVDLSTDRHGLPVSRILESGATDDAKNPVAEGESPPVGDGFRLALRSIDALASQIRPQRPALVQELGLPPSLRCDWTVLPGAHVDAGALATYIAGRGAAEGEERALWDYRLDVGRSVSSYFIVSKVPRSVLSSLAAKSLSLGPVDASSALRELAEVGFAVGETMRSGKAAVGVLGVVGALRLARAAWGAGEANGRRWCTVLLPVDCFSDLLVAPPTAGATSKRTDLLAINVAWNTDGPPALTISPCAVECKYVSTMYPGSTVQDALGQAEATYRVVSQLLALAQSDVGMHARLAISQILRFGLRLLVARRDATMADEHVVLDAILSGSFDLLPAIAPTLLVTTSCAAKGDGVVDVRADGWWVQLTSDSWPKAIPSSSNRIVRQLSRVFPAIVQPTGDDGAGEGGRTPGATSPSSAPSPSGPPEPAGQGGEAPSSAGPTAASAPAGSPRSGASEAPPGDSGAGAEVETASTALVHPVFNGFVGNRAAVEALSIQLRYVEQTHARVIRSVGLFGPKSTGKTELSRRLAGALGVPYLPLSETGLGDIDQLADRMQERAREAGTPMTVVDRQGGQAVLLSPPMLVFIDEVHQLNARVQDTLLPVLEADDRMLRGSRIIIDARDVSFVIATTDWGKLREPFRSRVRAIELEPYSAEQVAQMLRFRIEAASAEDGNGVGIDPAVAQLGDDALVAIATAARAVPRVALDLLREIGMALRIRICGGTADAVWAHLQRMVPCDRQGLTRRDRKYLRIVAKRGPIGLDNIAIELGVDKSNVEGAVEPFLVQMGWVQRGSSGRTLTTSGRQIVARLPQPDE